MKNERKVLLLKKNGAKYYMSEWNINYHIEDNGQNFIIISGMDYNGMYFQMKVDKIISTQEYGSWTEMEV